VLNLMQVGGAQQVMLEVKVAEVNRSILRRLGVNFAPFLFGNRSTFGTVTGGAAFPDALFGPQQLRVPVFSGGAPVVPRSPIGPPIQLFEPSTPTIPDTGLFASYLRGDFFFNMAIEASKTNGLAKILAEPTLTTMTGQEAQFLSGGEFPIPVPQGTNLSTTIEFREFGIGLRFLPVVLDSQRINLKVNVKVSELSADAAVVVQVPGTAAAFSIPSLTTRSASSTVELADGQTMGIAGLISDNVRESITKFPGLGDIPGLGILFRSQEFIKGETELVIFVTPRLARPIPPQQVRLPTDSFVEPTDLEFYLLGRMEGARPAARGAALEGSAPEQGFGHQF
jgi:pilus assembly protein CpaC